MPPRQYSPEFRVRALRLVDTTMESAEVSEFEAIKSVASKLGGVAEESVRRWRRKSQIDAGERPGVTTSEHAEIRRLKREVAELRRANEILKSASAFFRSGTRPPRNEMIAYIDAHRDQFGGVEFICRVLRAAIPGFFFTSRGYRDAKTRPPRCDRALRDELLIAELATVHRANYSVYGVKKKMQHAMIRRGWSIGREQTRRLMHLAGLRGVRRGKPVFTTITDPPRPDRPIWSTGSSPPAHPIGSGSPTSPTCGPGRGGSATPRSSPMPALNGSSGGRCRPR